MVLPVWAWMQPFLDRGKIRYTNGNYVRGADPHIFHDGTQFVVHRTFGPTKPGASGAGQGYPGTFQLTNSGPNPTTAYISGGQLAPTVPGTSSEIVLRPYPPDPAFEDHCGNEVFTMCQNWAGNYVVIYHGYMFGSRSVRSTQQLYVATGPSAKGPWTKQSVAVPEDPVFGTIITISEPSIVKHSSIVNRLEGIFNSRSILDEGGGEPVMKQRIWRMWSDDDGVTWSHSTTPLLSPPGPWGQPGQIGTWSHGALWVENRGGAEPVVYHMFHTRSGNTSSLTRGLIHRACLETELDITASWELNPNSPTGDGRVIFKGPVGSEYETRNDGPGPYQDPVTREWYVLTRGKNDKLLGSTTLETRGRGHIRVSTPRTAGEPIPGPS